VRIWQDGSASAPAFRRAGNFEIDSERHGIGRSPIRCNDVSALRFAAVNESQTAVFPEEETDRTEIPFRPKDRMDDQKKRLRAPDANENRIAAKRPPRQPSPALSLIPPNPRQVQLGGNDRNHNTI